MAGTSPAMTLEGWFNSIGLPGIDFSRPGG
jgi:hypothetical protein